MLKTTRPVLNSVARPRHLQTVPPFRPFHVTRHRHHPTDMSTQAKSEDVVVLYDIPSREPCSAWSLNPWKSKSIPQLVPTIPLMSSPRSCIPFRLKSLTSMVKQTARLVLNYKNIPYRTEWVEYPDLAPTLSKLVAKRESATHSTEEFTSPTVSSST
jgi:hypothetical protein